MGLLHHFRSQEKNLSKVIRKESPMHRGAPRRMKIVLFSRE
ncbi:hypothetical protein [Candidatus Hakubella thermalkaliphila]|nr:hypothetical protein [Candidatus Hakubella thermalkaliphila]